MAIVNSTAIVDDQQRIYISIRGDAFGDKIVPMLVIRFFAELTSLVFGEIAIISHRHSSPASGPSFFLSTLTIETRASDFE